MRERGRPDSCLTGTHEARLYYTERRPTSLLQETNPATATKACDKSASDKLEGVTCTRAAAHEILTKKQANPLNVSTENIIFLGQVHTQL